MKLELRSRRGSKASIVKRENRFARFESRSKKHPSIEELHTFSIQYQSNWMSPIFSFLRDGRLPVDADEARKIKKQTARFTILNDILYKRDFSILYLSCVKEEEAKFILKEVHEGICGDHTGPRSLVSKIIRIGYFWPTMQKDAGDSSKDAISARGLGTSNMS